MSSKKPLTSLQVPDKHCLDKEQAMALTAFFAQLPLRDIHTKAEALAELESSLLKCTFRPDAAAARLGIERLIATGRHVSYYGVLRRANRLAAFTQRGLGRIPFGPCEERWELVVAIRPIKRVIAPLTARVVQITYKRRLRNIRAATCIQRAMLRKLYSPNARRGTCWACCNAVRELEFCVQNS